MYEEGVSEDLDIARLDEHRLGIRRYLAGMLRPEELEDATQTVLERALIHQERFRGDSSARSWLLGIARNVGLETARSRQRKQRRRYHAEDLNGTPTTDLLPSGEPSPEVQLGRKEEHALALAALDEMSLDDKLVLLVTYVDGVPGPEAAEILDLSFDAFRQRLSRARRGLRRRLEKLQEAEEARGAEVLAAWEALLHPKAQESESP